MTRVEEGARCPACGAPGRHRIALYRAIRRSGARVTVEHRRFPLMERAASPLHPRGVRRGVLARARNRDRLDGRPAPDQAPARLSARAA